ncbi:MAG TPA: zinc ribbon domain-containing protein [Thermoleophilaceae bacterium]|nr:zinc ribbon domain-containing protein [Thermoleophilaceae bacterium]
MALLAIFGITNDGLNLAVNLLLLFLVVLWLALVFWTHADAKRRIADPMLVGCATAAAIFPFVGTIVYMVVRPPEYLEDVHERELEIAAAEARLAAAHEHACPYCEYPVERAFLRCPSCLRRLKEPCGTCSKPLDPRWKICPYCEAEAPERAKPQQRRRGRERPAADAETRATQKRPAAKADQRPATSAGSRKPADPRRERQPASGDARPKTERPKPGAPADSPSGESSARQ